MLSVIAAIASPFVSPVYTKMTQTEYSIIYMILEMLVLAVVAFGAYGITRRNPLGLLLVLVPCIVWLFSGNIILSLIYSFSASVIFGLPLYLSYLELQRNVSDQKKSNE